MSRVSLFQAYGRDGEGAKSADRSDFWNPTLNIRFRQGHATAFCYSHILWLNFDPSIGIILHFSTHTVKLFGRNLRPLYQQLLELRLREIEVIDERHDLGEADVTVVHRALIIQKPEHTAAERERPREGPDKPTG